jgi:hypothetical protein
MNCPSLETLSAWAVDELAAPELEAVEDHLFTCDRCVARAGAALDLVRALRGMLPIFLTGARRKALDASGRPLAVVAVRPGERRTIEFGGDVSVGYWVLQADLTAVGRVDCEVRPDDGGPAMAEVPDAPFDRERGEIILGCQRQYAEDGHPLRIRVKVTAVEGGERRPLAEYFLNHVIHPV